MSVPANEQEMNRLNALRESGAAYQLYEITDNGGIYDVRCETNDDDDDGYPERTTPVVWHEHGYSLEGALKRTGKSRQGWSGVVVIVTLNGEPVLP